MRKRKMKPYKFSMKNNIEKMSRQCLRCDRSFIAKGRFNRICPKCATHFDYHGEDPLAYRFALRIGRLTPGGSAE